MENLRTEKLIQYTALSTAFLVAHQANAQEYHEFDPYLPLTNASEVFIDIDDDGSDDFSFYFAKSWGTSSTGYSGNNFQFHANQFGDNEILITTLPAVEFFSSFYTIYCSFPETLGVVQLNEAAVISADDDWGKAQIMARVDHCGWYGGDGEQGEWLLEGGTKDYFVGFRTKADDGNYGWMRIRHYDFGDVDYIKDFFISNTPGGEVQTPDLSEMIAPAAENLNLYYGIGGVLMLDFDAADNEDDLQEYRVILRNTTFPSTITARICEITLPDNYISVNKTGSATYSADISALNSDWMGNSIEIGEGIEAFVYSKFNYPITLLNSLSAKSNELSFSDNVSIHNNVIDGMQIWQHNHVLYITSTKKEVENIVITNMLGQTVYSESVDLMEEHITIPYEFTPGIYVVSILTLDGVLSQQIKL